MTSNQVEVVTLEQSSPEIDALNKLFNRARLSDEFEYVCCLLRVRGLEDVGWDPLEETFALVNNLTSLLSAPLDTYAKIRLMLLLYSHITEVDAIYWTLENLLLVSDGKGCNSFPFDSLYRNGRKGRIPPSASSVVNYIIRHAKASGEDQFATMLENMFDEGVRNAFFHSDYTLHKDEFRTREGSFWQDQEVFSITEGQFVQHRMRTQVLKFPELVALINRGLAFYQAFNYVRVSHARSYKEEKTIETRLGTTTFMVHPEFGVYGFKGTGISQTQSNQ